MRRYLFIFSLLRLKFCLLCKIFTASALHIGGHFLWHIFVRTFCRHFFVDTFCAHFLWTFFCGHVLWKLFVNTFCGHFLWTLLMTLLFIHFSYPAPPPSKKIFLFKRSIFWTFLFISVSFSMGATIRIGREIQCRPYVGFFMQASLFWSCKNKMKTKVCLGSCVKKL